MSDYENLVAARAAADDMRVQSQLSGMDPGYATGFTLTLDPDYQVTVSAGATTVFGSEVRIAEETQLTDNMFVGTKFGPFWYYIYVTREGTFSIDRAIPSLSSTLFYYTHPFAEQRAIGRLWVSDTASTRLANQIIYAQTEVDKADPLVLVAPSDTSGGAEAAYKLTGTSDEILINASIQYLSEVHSGGVASILRGTVSTAAVITLLANVELVGDGVATVIAGTADDLMITSTHDGCAVRRMKITTVATSSSKDVIYYNGADDTSVEEVTISGASVDAIVFNDSDRTVIKDVAVLDAKTAINITGTSEGGNYDNIHITRTSAATITLIGFAIGPNTLRYNASNVTIDGLSTSGSASAYGALIDGDASNASNFIVNSIVSTGGAAWGVAISSSNCHYSNINVKTVTGNSTIGAEGGEGEDGVGVIFTNTASTNTMVNLEANTCNGTGLLIRPSAQYVTVFGAILSGNGTNLTNSGTRNTIVTNDSTAEFSGPLDEALTIDSAGVDMAGTLDVVGRAGVGIANTTTGMLTILSDTNHRALSLIENSGGESWQVGVTAEGNLNFMDSGGSVGTFTIQDVTGNVGIGTSSPQSLTHLQAGVSPTLQLENTTTGNSPVLLFDGLAGANADYLLGQISAGWDGHTNIVASIRFESGDDTGNKDDGVISFWTSPSSSTVAERMRVDHTGNVGIGTSSPNEAGDDSTQFGGISLEVRNGSGGGNLMASGSTSAAFRLLDRGAGSNDKTSVGVNDGGITYLGSVNDANSAYVNQYIMTWDHGSGDVGIGTSSPESLVHLQAERKPTLQLENTIYGNAPVLLFDGYVGANADWWLGQISAGWDGHTNVVASIIFEAGDDTGNKDDGVISFWTSPSSSTIAERMRVDHTGNVGIGDTNPSYKLDVTGHMRSTKGRVAAKTYANSGLITQNTAYDEFSAFLDDGETIIASGIIEDMGGDDWIISHMSRSGTQIEFIGAEVATGTLGQLSAADGSSTPFSNTFSIAV